MKNLWRNIWETLNADIEFNWSGTVKGTVEVTKQLLALAKAIEEKKKAPELAKIINNNQISSLLSVLNDPLVQVAGTALPFIPIATGIITFIIDKTKKEPTLAMSVALISQGAYLESFQRFFEDYPQIKAKLKDAPPSEQISKEIHRLGVGEELELDESEAEKTLVCFHESKLAQVFNRILQTRLKESNLEPEEAKIVTARISCSTHRYLKKALVEVRDSVPKLAARYGGGWQQDLEAYVSIDQYLEDVIAQKPQDYVFDEDFRFQDIYVPLKVKAVRDGEINQKAYAENMESWATRLLLDEKKKEQVLFIQGGPGRGKSLFCRMFADLVRIELHPIYTPIFIRLRDLKTFANNFDETLAAAVGRDFVTNDSGWLTDRNTRFLFFLDGFDELLLERGKSNSLRDFLDQVASFQKGCKENRERGHRVIITGRPLALYGIERLMPNNLEWVGITLMDEELQQEWLAKWQTVVDEDSTKAAKETQAFRDLLQNESCPQQVRDLAREPLLLYLLAAMHRDGQFNINTLEGEDNNDVKVSIYQAVVDWVLNKQRSEGREQQRKSLTPRLTGLDAEGLRSVMTEAGLCVVQSENEQALVKMIEDRLVEKGDQGATEIIEQARQAKEKDPLKNALAAFYIKATAGKDNSVEFFHKSFGEFLCAERLAESLEEWTEKSGRRRKTYETYTVKDGNFEWQVYDLLGYGHLSKEIIDYLMPLLKKSDVDWLALFERLHEFYLYWSKGDFIEILDPSVEILPLKKARQLHKYGFERGQRQVDIYIGLNVLILLLEIHRYAQSQENFKSQINFYPCGNPENEEEFEATRLSKIIGYSECLGASTFNRQIKQFLSEAKLSGADLSGANLSGAKLSGADLSGAHLSGAHLSGAHLSGAHLRGAHLRGAHLSRANLIEADLSGAHFSRADLSGADLSRADLSGADLSRAHLRGAQLSRAHLSRAHLSRAHLSGADLRGAHLRGAHLSEADLSRAYLIRVNLSGADLIEAKLSGADLSRAHLRGAHLRGAYLIRVNLSGADLSGADLRGADLRVADLRVADLSGVDLSRADLSRAKLIEADLSRAKLIETDLSQIQWDEKTQWTDVTGLDKALGVPEEW